MFNYGPATLYLPFWLSRISAGAVSFEQAYTMFVALFTVAGFISLFVLLRSLDLPTSVRVAALALMILGWTSFTFGLQYTPLRFVIVPVSLIALDAFTRHRSSSLALGVASGIAVACCVAISPEMGISGAVAVVAYGAVHIFRRAFHRAAACCCGAAAAAVGTLLLFPGYLQSVFAFAAGGENFPVFPNLHNICLIIITLVTLPGLLAASVAHPAERRAPLAASLAIGGGMLLPAALGRCDPGHVFINSLVPIVLMFPAACSAGKLCGRLWCWCCAILYVLCLQFSYWNTYYESYSDVVAMRYFYEHNPQVITAWKHEWSALRRASPHGADLNWSKTLYFPDELAHLTSDGPVLLTSGNDGNLWLVRYLLLQPKLLPDYFNAYSQGAVTAGQIERKVRESRLYKYLIIPRPVLDELSNTPDPGSYARNASAYLSKLLLFPVSSPVKFPAYEPDSEYARRILLEFKPILKFHSYIVLQKRNVPLDPPHSGRS